VAARGAGQGGRRARHFLITTLAVDSREELMFRALGRVHGQPRGAAADQQLTVRTVRQQSSTYQSLQDELQQGGRPAPIFSPARVSTCSSSMAG